MNYTINYITPAVNTPKSGGEIHLSKFIKRAELAGYTINTISFDQIPKIFKTNQLMFNFWFILNHKKINSGLIFIDSYMRPKTFLFLLFLKIFRPSVHILGTVMHLFWPLHKNRLVQIIDKFIESIFIQCLDYLIVCSQYTRKSVEKIIFKKPKTFVIYPGTDRKKITKVIHTPKKKLRYIFVGGIQERKGLFYLIEALNLLPERNFELVIVGDMDKDPAYVKKIKELIVNYNLQPNIVLKGWVDNAELDSLYSSSDIFILPTLHEGYGIVIVEAMHYGLPIISTNITSIPELVSNGDNGILVSPHNSTEIKNAIIELSTNFNKRKQMGEKSVELAQNTNTWNDAENQFINVINELIK